MCDWVDCETLPAASISAGPTISMEAGLVTSTDTAQDVRAWQQTGIVGADGCCECC
ncbi:MAG: hypothetical protein ACM358_12290 [Gemmatimonadota bacterium]